MATYHTADVDTVPPSTDDIYDALKNEKIFATENTKKGLKLFLRDPYVEQFNFGPLALDVVHQAQTDGVQFICHKHFVMPHKTCIYRSTIKYDNVDVGVMVLSYAEGDGAVPDKIATVRVIRAREDGMLFAMRSINMMNTKLGPEGLGCEFYIPNDEIEYWKPRLGDCLDEMQWQVTEGGLISMGLTMILNTKGVLKERSAPPAKPNKARAAKGRPLLPYTTRVYTAVYNKAVEAGPAGTHASPRPHIRRAHIRHYPKTEKHEAYVLPIAAMLVNFDGRPLEARREYVVK